MVKYILRAALQASKILNIDKNLCAQWGKMIGCLPSYPKTQGENSVIVDVKGAPPIIYNIPIPAFPVLPGEDTTFYSENKELMKRSLKNMQTNGNNSFVITAIAKARLSLPSTYNYLKKESQYRTRPNGVLVMNRLKPHHSFNDFGCYTEMFGVTMAISEMLLQSVDGIIRLFPAWPREIDAEFMNLRAVGGFLISAKLQNGKVKQVGIQSTAGGDLQLLKEWDSFRIVNENSKEGKKL